MAKVNVRVVFRSPKEEEIRPGVRSYVYTVSKPLRANVNSSGYTITDGQTMNELDTPQTELSVIIANDRNDRLRNISFVEYCGTLYKVASAKVVRPRVNITLGTEANEELDELPKKEVKDGE